MSFGNSMLLALTCAVLAVAGCSSTGSSGRGTSSGIVRESGKGAVGTMLSKELQRFGCQVELDTTALAETEVRWVVDRDPDGASVWIEGEHAASILTEFKKRFGDPALVKSADTNGHLFFVYRKDQCGVLVDCSVETRSGWAGLSAPMTVVGIHTKVIGLF